MTYSDAAKIDMLKVEAAALQQHGAVSEVVARQMALGACRAAGVEASLAVTGIAGPDGGSEQKPVGTVWLAWSVAGRETLSECVLFTGDRQSVRLQTVRHALRILLHQLGADSGKSTEALS